MKAHVLAVVTGLALTLAALPCRAVDADGFTVVKITGPSVQCLAGTAYVNAELNRVYPFGTTLKTGRGSTADLQLSPENTFRLMPRTTLTIARDADNSRLKSLKLEQGAVQVKLDKMPAGDKLEVETPTAVCGALGTHFSVAFEDTPENLPDNARQGTRENVVTCDQGTVFAASSFTVDGRKVRGQTLDAPAVKEGTTVVAVIHEGKENSYTDVSLVKGEAELNYGVKDGGQVRLKAGDTPARVVCAMEKNDGPVAVAAMRVQGGTVEHVTPGSKGLFGRKDPTVTQLSQSDGAILFTGGDVLLEQNTTVVSDYLAAAETEGKVHSGVVDKRKQQVATPADEAALLAAADKATSLRKQLLTRQMRDTLRNIRGGARRQMRIRH